MIDHLTKIYGRLCAPSIGARANAILTSFADEHPELGGSRPQASDLGPDDTILITYADQFRSEGEAPLKTLKRFVDNYLGEAITGIHILPCYPSSSDDGFAVTDYDRVDPAFGTWDDIEALSLNYKIMLDVVANHSSAQGTWFDAYRADTPPYNKFFIEDAAGWDLSSVARPRTSPILTTFEIQRAGSRTARQLWTTFSTDQVDLDYRNPEVLLAMLQVLLNYVARGASLLRLDAISFIWKESGTSCAHQSNAHEIVKFFRACLDRVAPRVSLVTETNVPHAENISYFGDGRDEAQLVYNFSLPPLVVHAIQTGDFEPLEAWRSSLKPCPGSATWFNFLASHDGIGLRPAEGLLSTQQLGALADRCLERGGQVGWRSIGAQQAPYELQSTLFDLLAIPGEELKCSVDRFAEAHRIMFDMPGAKGLYVHSLFGSPNDQTGYRVSGQGRRLNRARFDYAKLEHDLASDPRTKSSFGAIRELLS